MKFDSVFSKTVRLGRSKPWAAIFFDGFGTTDLLNHVHNITRGAVDDRVIRIFGVPLMDESALGQITKHLGTTVALLNRLDRL